MPLTRRLSERPILDVRVFDCHSYVRCSRIAKRTSIAGSESPTVAMSKIVRGRAVRRVSQRQYSRFEMFVLA